jgi:hypothetical protein
LRTAPGQKFSKSGSKNVELLSEKKGTTPTVGIIDSQSVKSVQKRDAKGFDAGKKSKGSNGTL